MTDFEAGARVSEVLSGVGFTTSLVASRVEAVADWLERIFGPDVADAHHEDTMRAADWKYLAEAVIRIGDEAALND